MTREQLYEIRDVYREREEIKDRITRLESMRVSPRTAVYGDGCSRSSLKGDMQPDLIAQMDDMIRLYNHKLRRCIALTDAFEHDLECLTSRERRIMRLYYIDGLTWEQVGEAMRLSNTRIYQKKRDAIRKIIAQ